MSNEKYFNKNFRNNNGFSSTPDNKYKILTIYINYYKNTASIMYDHKNVCKLFTELRKYRGEPENESKIEQYIIQKNFERWNRIYASAFALDLEFTAGYIMSCDPNLPKPIYKKKTKLQNLQKLIKFFLHIK